MKTSEEQIFDKVVKRRVSTLKTWMDITIAISKESNAPDKQVGAVAIDSHENVIGYGYNYSVDEDFPSTVDENGKTKDTTLHAEIEMIHRAMETGKNLEGATIFLTHSPCTRCAAQLKRSKIKRIYFLEEFKGGMSHDFLLRHGIELIQVTGVREEIDKRIQEEEDLQDHLLSLETLEPEDDEELK